MRTVILRAFAMLLLIGALCGLICGLYVLDQPEYDTFLNVAFIGTADEADCIILWQKDFAMMIDTGEDRDAEAILAFLAEMNITKLNYLVLTHPDKDHIGSVPAVTHSLKVSTVIQPFYQKENDANRYVQARLAQDNVRVVVPARVLHYSVNDVDIYVYPPLEKNYSENNNYSLAVYVKHRNVSMLLPGDADNKRLDELMQLDWDTVDLYKLPRHGWHSEDSEELFSILRPEYSVVTADGVSGRFYETGSEWGTEWFFTEGNTVRFQSDGETMHLIER